VHEVAHLQRVTETPSIRLSEHAHKHRQTGTPSATSKG
jgi:hypothetical protein